MFRSDVGTYVEINKLISDSRVKVNGMLQTDNNYKVDTESDFVDVDGTILNYRKYVYIMINKPEGYMCSDKDREFKTVIELLPEWSIRRDIKPVNYVDRMMSGLVLLTDDLSCQHLYSANKRRNDMVYHVQTNVPVTIKHGEAFAAGMKMKHFTGEIATLSKADSYYKDEYAARLTTKESRFNEIEKMFRVLGVEVLSIELIAIGDLVMPIELNEGKWRELQSHELKIMRIKSPY